MATISCDPSDLANAGRCFNSCGTDQLALKSYLLCQLENKGFGPTPPPAPCAFGTAWAARVVANGGAMPSTNTINAICTFQNGLITDGLDTSMISWNAIAPDNLIAARTPQLVGGGNDPWQNSATPFVNADLSVNGLLGNIGKGLDTGIIPNTVFPSDGNAGLTYYMTSNGGPATLACFDTNGGVFLHYPNFTGFGYFFACYGAGGFCPDRINDPAFGNFNGYVSGNRTALNAMSAYKANSGTPHVLIGSCAGNTTGVRPIVSIWAILDRGSGSAYPGTFSFFAIHLGLTSAQSALFFARIQTLRTTLGGGFA